VGRAAEDERREREHPSFSTGGDGNQPLEDDDLPF
jgi:hypothetical protein